MSNRLIYQIIFFINLIGFSILPVDASTFQYTNRTSSAMDIYPPQDINLSNAKPGQQFGPYYYSGSGSIYSVCTGNENYTQWWGSTTGRLSGLPAPGTDGWVKIDDHLSGKVEAYDKSITIGYSSPFVMGNNNGTCHSTTTTSSTVNFRVWFRVDSAVAGSYPGVQKKFSIYQTYNTSLGKPANTIYEASFNLRAGQVIINPVCKATTAAINVDFGTKTQSAAGTYPVVNKDLIISCSTSSTVKLTFTPTYSASKNYGSSAIGFKTTDTNGSAGPDVTMTTKGMSASSNIGVLTSKVSSQITVPLSFELQPLQGFTGSYTSSGAVVIEVI